MQNQDLLNTTLIDNKTELAGHGLQVQETMTTPSKPGKKPRPVWVVRGNVFGLEEFFRDTNGRKFRGSWSFFEDPSHKILEFLKSNKRLSYAEQVQSSIDRKIKKSLRYEGYAVNAETRAEERCKTADKIISMIPPGQPILIGHHSERRHRKDLKRIETNMLKSNEESKKAEYFSDKSHRLARAAEKLESRRFIGNRINDVRKKIAQLSNWLDSNNPRLLQAQEKLEYWQNRLDTIEAKQKEKGCAIASPETIKIGDLVYYISSWLPVVRVNKKTVTVSNWSNRSHSQYKIAYTRISKFKSKPEA